MIIKRQSFFYILQVFCNAYYKIKKKKKKKTQTHYASIQYITC